MLSTKSDRFCAVLCIPHIEADWHGDSCKKINSLVGVTEISSPFISINTSFQTLCSNDFCCPAGIQ